MSIPFCINSEELSVLLQHLGVQLEGDDLINVMTDLLGSNNDTGEISFEEFYACEWNGLYIIVYMVLSHVWSVW